MCVCAYIFQRVLRVLRTISDYLAGNVVVDKSLPRCDFHGDALLDRIVVILRSDSDS